MAKKLNVVLAGCGSIASSWMNTDTVKKHVEIVGLVDIKKASIKAFAERQGIADVTSGTDLAKVLKATEPDAVFDCSVPEAHCGITVTALKHGCHVLGEKPMSDKLVSARKMVAAAQKAGKIYAVIQNRRYKPEIQALRKFIASGAIGKISTVQSNFFVGVHFGGFRDKMKHVLILDMAIHTFDAARYISGADAKSVYCHEWNPVGSWYDHDASAVAIFEMTDDIVYTYEGSWAAEGCNTTWECDWRIIGSKGSVLWNGGTEFTAEIVDAKKGFVRKTKPVKVPCRKSAKFASGHDGVIKEFVAAIRKGGEPDTVCTDNIKSVAMVCSAVKSSETGRKIKIA